MSDDLPLSGIRVLAFTHAVLGPTTGLFLADFGAEVIRIEPSPHGDHTRRLKGFGIGFSTFLNRNKKSLAVNLKTEEGQAVIQKLLATADVLIENFGPGTMERLGLGADRLKIDFPRLIYCSLKGFMPGPYENRMALDEVVQMMSGLAYMTGRPGDPLRAGASVVDIMTGMNGVIGVLLALRQRDQTGQGEQVKSTLFESAVFLMGQHMAYQAISGQTLPPMPVRVSTWGVYHQFMTADEQRVFIGVTSDQQWERFCRAFGCEAWLEDERIATNNGRVAEKDWLLPQIAKMVSGMSKDAVIAACEQAILPFSPVARPEDLFTDEQLIQGDGLVETNLPNGEKAPLPRTPIRLGDKPFPLRNHPPEVGDKTADLLKELGYSSEEVSRLAEQNIVKAISQAID